MKQMPVITTKECNDRTIQDKPTSISFLNKLILCLIYAVKDLLSKR